MSTVFIVTMVRDSVEPGGRDRFSCSSSDWQLLHDVAVAFGWKPEGAVYLSPQGAPRVGSSARRDYRPGEQQDFKQVEADDAIAWAAALSEARRSPYLPAMLGTRTDPVTLSDASDDQVRSVNAPFVATMDEFIEYAFGGAFAFVRAG